MKSFSEFIGESHESRLDRLKELGLHPHEYTFDYAYWYGEDDYDFDQVTVEAYDENEAREKAYKAARLEHRHVRSSPEKMELLLIDGKPPVRNGGLGD